MAAKKRRRGARQGKRDRAATRAAVAPYISRQIPTYCHATEEQLELVEHNADTVLEEIGIEFRDFPRALELFKDAGADIDGAACAERLFRTVPRSSLFSTRVTRIAVW